MTTSNDWLRDEIAYIRASLGDLAKSYLEMRADIVEIRADLREHIRRTSLAEENIERVRSEVKPIATHVAVVAAIAKLVAFIGVVVGIAVGITKLLGIGG